MANIKNIVKKLVNNGYSEDKLMLMTEKEIREAYKAFKKEKEEITMNNNATVETAKKEEFIMIKEIKKLAKSYDCFTYCIDDYSQQKEAESRNHELAVKFVAVANKMGINATVNDLYEIASDNKGIDEAIETYIKSHEVEVVSITSTEQNGELTFVELSPEQKIQISAVLSAQIQDVNYSSWFEEENGIFKLYGAWVDEKPILEAEYSFNGDKFIKAIKEEIDMNINTTVTKEEIVMRNNTTATTVTKEEIIMKEMKGTDIFFKFKAENFSLVETWADAWSDYGTEENEKLVKEVTSMRYPLALQAAKIAVKNINPEETMSYRVLSADRKFWCDCGLSNNKIIVKTACALDGDDPKIKNGYGCIHDFNSAKEEVIMENNNATTKEEVKMDTKESTVTVNNTTTKKEVITMTDEMIKKLDTMNRTMQLVQVLEWCDNIKNVHDVCYVKKDVLAQFLFDKDLIGHHLSKRELKKIKRGELIANLREAVDNLREAGIITPITPVAKVVSVGDFCNDEVSKGEPDNTIDVGDFCRDNAPESIEEPALELNKDMASKILERVIRQADTNKAKNFISNWMLTSAISEVLFGTPLKEKKNGEVIEHWKGFSKEQNATLALIHREFVRKSGLVVKKKEGTIVGYVIPAKVLVWGRNKYLNKVCVYKFVDKNGRPLAEYLVSMSGIKDAATGKIIPLTADSYDTLDAKCVFVR